MLKRFQPCGHSNYSDPFHGPVGTWIQSNDFIEKVLSHQICEKLLWGFFLHQCSQLLHEDPRGFGKEKKQTNLDKTLYLQDRQYGRRHKMPLIEYIDTSSTENKKEKNKSHHQEKWRRCNDILKLCVPKYFRGFPNSAELKSQIFILVQRSWWDAEGCCSTNRNWSSVLHNTNNTHFYLSEQKILLQLRKRIHF